jgi:hypothetical protein
MAEALGETTPGVTGMNRSSEPPADRGRLPGVPVPHEGSRA